MRIIVPIERSVRIRIHHISLSDDDRVTLTGYTLDHWPMGGAGRIRPAVLVLPGGGYRAISEGEADPIALSYVAKGMHAFVLRYSIDAFGKFPAAFIDASVAMAYIRSHAAEWGIHTEQIIVCGMSAGGHLAACLGTMWNSKSLTENAGIPPGSNKPNALILGYPVITCDPHVSGGIGMMWKSAAGDRPVIDMHEQLSCELHVGSHTPPCFMFHTFMDQVVPVKHVLLFGQALADHGVPFGLHVYPNGPHGLSLANEVTATKKEALDEDVAGWMDLSYRWLKRLFDIS